MLDKIFLILLLIVTACTTTRQDLLSDKEIEEHSSKFVKKIDYLTNLKYGKLIIKYDLLNIDSMETCLISRLNNKVFHPSDISKKHYLKYLDSLEQILERKISSNSWLNIIVHNTEDKISKIKYLKSLKNYKVDFSDLLANLNSNTVFDLLEDNISFRDVEKKLKTLLSYNEFANSVPILLPIYNAEVTSRFSLRKDPFTGKLKKHLGIDLKSKDNTKIYASAKGIVAWAGVKSGYGNLIIINHGPIYSTRYAHLNKVVVKKGSKVKAGQFIGTQGNTGKSTASHLHYEIRINGEAINPEVFLNIASNCRKN